LLAVSGTFFSTTSISKNINNLTRGEDKTFFIGTHIAEQK
jgi:hypothetical protein